MLGARFRVRAAEDGHLTHLKAHAVHVACQEWLLLAAAVAHPTRRGLCRDRALRGNRALNILQDHAFII
jgi:hypothetical protein